MGFFGSSKKNKNAENEKRSQTNGTGSDGPASGSARSWKQRFQRMFEVYDQPQLRKLDDMMTIAGGREAQIMAALVKRYGPEPVDAPSDIAHTIPTSVTQPPAVAAEVVHTQQGGSSRLVELPWEERFRRMFVCYDPSQLPKLAGLMQMSKGREVVLLAALVKRYGAEPPRSPVAPDAPELPIATGDAPSSPPPAAPPTTEQRDAGGMGTLAEVSNIHRDTQDPPPPDRRLPTRSPSVASDPFDLAQYSAAVHVDERASDGTGGVVTVLGGSLEELEDAALESYHSDQPQVVAASRRIAPPMSSAAPQWEEYWDQQDGRAFDDEALPLRYDAAHTTMRRKGAAVMRQEEPLAIHRSDLQYTPVHPAGTTTAGLPPFWSGEVAYMASELKLLRQRVARNEASIVSKDMEISELKKTVASLQTALEIVHSNGGRTSPPPRDSPRHAHAPPLYGGTTPLHNTPPFIHRAEPGLPPSPASSRSVHGVDLTVANPSPQLYQFFNARSTAEGPLHHIPPSYPSSMVTSDAHPSCTRMYAARRSLTTPSAAAAFQVPTAPDPLPPIGSQSPHRRPSPQRAVTFDVGESAGPHLENPLRSIKTATFQKQKQQKGASSPSPSRSRKGPLYVGPSCSARNDYSLAEYLPASLSPKARRDRGADDVGSPMSQLLW